MTRSLGLIIYPDGSQAEIVDQSQHPMHGSVRFIIPLPWPRELRALYLAQ